MCTRRHNIYESQELQAHLKHVAGPCKLSGTTNIRLVSNLKHYNASSPLRKAHRMHSNSPRFEDCIVALSPSNDALSWLGESQRND
jgi:hypothetical protein